VKRILSWLRRSQDPPDQLEREWRAVLGVPEGYPERLAGADEAARQGDFPAWAAEMEEAGLSAGDIILSVRQEAGE
jgi:hypothetical protein